MQNKDERDGSELLAAWQQRNEVHRFEGSLGVRHLGNLVEALNEDSYSDIVDFLVDNPGACDAVVNFIEEWLDRNESWRQNLRKKAGPADGQVKELKALVTSYIQDKPRADPEDVANTLADRDKDLQDESGEILEWVFDICEEVIKEAQHAELVADAAEAAEVIGEDALEKYAAENPD